MLLDVKPTLLKRSRLIYTRRYSRKYISKNKKHRYEERSGTTLECSYKDREIVRRETEGKERSRTTPGTSYKDRSIVRRETEDEEPSEKQRNRYTKTD